MQIKVLIAEGDQMTANWLRSILRARSVAKTD